MLLTSRPDLLPIDLKRQGRAEVHIPLFYPHDPEEVTDMFRVLAGKNQIAWQPMRLPRCASDRELSGADIESIVLGAQRRAMTADRSEVTGEDLQDAIDAFIPSAKAWKRKCRNWWRCSNVRIANSFPMIGGNASNNPTEELDCRNA